MLVLSSFSPNPPPQASMGTFGFYTSRNPKITTAIRTDPSPKLPMLLLGVALPPAGSRRRSPPSLAAPPPAAATPPPLRPAAGAAGATATRHSQPIRQMSLCPRAPGCTRCSTHAHTCGETARGGETAEGFTLFSSWGLFRTKRAWGVEGLGEGGHLFRLSCCLRRQSQTTPGSSNHPKTLAAAATAANGLCSSLS